jgi:hypothetical protein
MTRAVAAALTLPVVFTAAALALVERNRSGGRAAIVLTERELRLQPRSDDKSAAVLSIDWRTNSRHQHTWLTRDKLRALGFRCDVDPLSRGAEEYYRRVVPRVVYVALEFDGPAWQQWLEEEELDDARRAESTGQPLPPGMRRVRETSSRLVVVDAGRDADTLASRYPDATRHLITAGVIQVIYDARNWPQAPLSGTVARLMPGRIHVPTALATALPPLLRPHEDTPAASYSVALRYGRRYEPWVERITPGSASR